MADQSSTNATAYWDAGELGCGQLIVGLKRRVSDLAPGSVLEVTAHGPGARIDIFVWCRMTGHRLLSEAHPIYRIQRSDA